MRRALHAADSREPRARESAAPDSRGSGSADGRQHARGSGTACHAALVSIVSHGGAMVQLAAVQLSGNLRQMNEKIAISLPAGSGRPARAAENRADEMLLRSRIGQVRPHPLRRGRTGRNGPSNSDAVRRRLGFRFGGVRARLPAWGYGGQWCGRSWFVW